MIKTVFLDVDNTLLDFDKCSELATKCAAEEAGLVLPENTHSVFNEINDTLWHMVEKEQLTREKLHKVRWSLIFKELGVEADGPDFEERFFRNLRLSAVPVDGAVELVEYLSRKYYVCVASNAAYEQQRQRLERAGMLQYIQKLFTSVEIGSPKPSKAFFDGCFDQLEDTEPSQVMMIGDSLEADIRGAWAYGIKTCWYNPKCRPYGDIPIDHEVRHLYEVMNIL